jgi:hypothetical protein
VRVACVAPKSLRLSVTCPMHRTLSMKLRRSSLIRRYHKSWQLPTKVLANSCALLQCFFVHTFAVLCTLLRCCVHFCGVVYTFTVFLHAHFCGVPSYLLLINKCLLASLTVSSFSLSSTLVSRARLACEYY